MINPKKKLELSPPENKKMKNDELDKKPPVEVIEGRLKQLHMNEIDARKRLRLREEEVGRAGKTKTTQKGKTDEYLEEKTPVEIIEERKQDFARVGWILDYGLRLRDEKGVGGR